VLEGWGTSTVGIKDFHKLPEAARAYIKKVENMLDVEVQLISTGQRRDELIELKGQF
jgi:adenylosuccinate synthase